MGIPAQAALRGRRPRGTALAGEEKWTGDEDAKRALIARVRASPAWQALYRAKAAAKAVAARLRSLLR